MSGESADLVRRVLDHDPDLHHFTPVKSDISLTERPITVDQTNESVVVGEQVVVKWMRTPAPDRSTPLLAHLAANGFTSMPAPHAALFDGDNLVALVTQFLPGGQDGWDWCVDDLLAQLDGGPPASFGRDLGILAADLHCALATPSALLPDPVVPAPPADGWADLLEEAVATGTHESPARSTHGWPTTSATTSPATSVHELPGPVVAGLPEVGDDWLVSLRPRLAADLDSPARAHPGKAIHVHGDLHVGQILRWRDGYAVIDFDGNPTLAAQPEPVARDVAQLRMSVLHVAEIANRRTAGRHRAELVAWGRRTADELLTAYRERLSARSELFNVDLLRPFEVEQECRELVYAARFLPRWRYAPLGVLRSWYG
ncbi:hypothetical protein [Paractinoplanes abujensis]|uniref:Glucosamine kinase n=1 Tax=Paractinoplanes abujensis TaxID=882441 RepID=A0A7W7CZR8_9ACTN|nr:hypothetical protein [Actinoplanes abujensis]MBB4697667.1 maltokinase [Actinoplanes abujensis]